MRKINSTDARKWVDYKVKMRDWFDVLLGEKKFNVVMSSNNNIRFELIRGGRELEAELGQLGTGVAQLFMILSYLFINKDRSMNVFVEEPECNLHPESVIKLVQIFEKEFTLPHNQVDRNSHGYNKLEGHKVRRNNRNLPAE